MLAAKLDVCVRSYGSARMHRRTWLPRHVVASAACGKRAMTKSALYPLRFEPIYQYRLWGGRRLADWLKAPLPSNGPIGEAWLLSDRDEHPSRVAEGPLKGRTIAH